MVLRWGIASTGKISNDFTLALKSLSQRGHKIEAVAASTYEKAKAFAQFHGISVAVGSYEELGKCCVDVVYIGAVNSLHYKIAKSMLESGKHVLCEKPLCTNVNNTRDLIRMSKEKNLFLMEGIWSRCFPLYQRLREALSGNVLGEVFHVEVNFGMRLSHIPRLTSKSLGGGTLLDLGVYTVQLALLTLGFPCQINGFGKLNDEGVDENAVIILQYPNGKTANLVTHSKVNLNNKATIYGTEGNITICDPFWCPIFMDIQTNSGEIDRVVSSLPVVEGKLNFMNSEGLVYEALEVECCLEKKLIESPLITHKESIFISVILEEVMKIIEMKS